VLLDVEGMKCGGCVRAVERTLLEQPGVRDASVNLVTRSAWVQLAADDDRPGRDDGLEPVLQALADRGFPAKPRGMSPV